MANFGEELRKTKRFSDKIEAAEKGATSVTREEKTGILGDIVSVTYSLFEVSKFLTFAV